MPAFDIIKENIVDKTFRVQSVIGQFDLKDEQTKDHFSGKIEIEDKQWNIGVIIGASGTGKSTIAKELFKNELITKFEYKAKSILDDMPDVDIKTICTMFNRVGFSSPPNWLKSYNVLSNGEKMRVDLARALLENRELIVFDEFISVVDRQVAKMGSYAIAKTIRKQNKKFIAVSCHNDILEWLEPDWVFDTNTMTFFLSQNIKDLKSIFRFDNAEEKCGEILGNIII